MKDIRAPLVEVRGADVTVALDFGPLPEDGLLDECALFIGNGTQNLIEIVGSKSSIAAIGKAIQILLANEEGETT